MPSIEKSELADPTLTVSNGLHAVVPIPILSKLPSLINALALIAPNCAQLLSEVNTNPVVPPRGGSWLNTMSPGLPAIVGVPVAIVIFLATVASPCRNILFASIPSGEDEVTFCENETGPSNCDRMSLFAPPSTLSDLATVASNGVIMSTPEAEPDANKSSPVIVGTGVSNTSSLPVLESIFLLPMKKSPLSFIPE